MKKHIFLENHVGMCKTRLERSLSSTSYISSALVSDYMNKPFIRPTSTNIKAYLKNQGKHMIPIEGCMFLHVRSNLRFPSDDEVVLKHFRDFLSL